MIIGIVGKRGEGKTISQTREVVSLIGKGRTIYTNYEINKNVFTHEQRERINTLSDDFFKKYAEMKLYNCGVFLDEIYVYIDSRSSMSKRNKIMSYFFNQTRKRDVDLYYTTQFMHQIDKRLRSNTELFIFPQKRVFDITGRKPKHVNVTDSVIKANPKKYHVYITNKIMLYGEKKFYQETFLANKFFKYYSTDEIVDFELE